MVLVYGVGTNDADYVVQPAVNGRVQICPFYRTWTNMLRRCYSGHDPTYSGCIVCDEWFIFSNFKPWMEAQDWQGKQLDKDFLGDGKLYSPQTCTFLPSWLNNIFSDHKSARGPYPLGVTSHKNKFRAKLKMDGKHTHLGLFDSPEEAHEAYKKAKRKYVLTKIKSYLDRHIIRAVLEKLDGKDV